MGGICWYCYWGWAKPVTLIYNEALKRLGNDESPLRYGPSHIVWEDENWGTESIQHCLDRSQPGSAEADSDGRFSEKDIAVVRWSLEELLKIPEEVRCCEPEDYDNANPANYPPKQGVEVLKP